jgi:hypothetical protein
MTISPRTAQQPFNSATISALGGIQISVGPGHVAAVPAVSAAGSTDAVATFFDGHDDTGAVIGLFSLSAVGPAGVGLGLANYSVGLFVNVIGTTPGTFTVTFTGQTAAS